MLGHYLFGGQTFGSLTFGVGNNLVGTAVRTIGAGARLEAPVRRVNSCFVKISGQKFGL